MSLAARWTTGPRPARLFSAVLADRLAFWAGVFILLILSQGWVTPLLGDKVDPGASGLVRNAFLPIYAIGLAMLGLRPISGLMASLRQPFLLMLLLMVCLSVFWSIDPAVTERRAFALICTTLCGVAIGSRWRWAQLAEVTGACFAVLAVMSLIVCVALPDIGRMKELFPGAWRGLWPEKNQLGGTMAMGFTILASAAWLNPARRWLWLGLAGLAVLLVLASTSKTSLVTLMLGGAGLAFVAMVRRGPAWAVVAVWGATAAIIGLTAFVTFDTAKVFELLGKDATLTGRTKIWAGVWRQIELRPWTGYGYMTVWSDESGRGPLAWITKQAAFKPQHAHNTWLEQWLGMGAVGLAAFALFYAQALLTALVSLFRTSGAMLAFLFLLTYSLISLTESVGVIYNDLRWVLLVTFAVKLAWPDRLIAQPADAPEPGRR